MKIKQCMTPEVKVVEPEMSIRDAARIMAETDTGSLPVGENDRLVGMITDRDIAVRAVATGMSPDTTIREVMSRDVRYCYDDESVEHVAKNMGDIQVRRLPVLNREQRLVGIVVLGDLAASGADKVVGEALGGICRPSGLHTQSLATNH